MGQTKHADKIYMIFGSEDGSYDYLPTSLILPSIFRRYAENLYQKHLSQRKRALSRGKNTFTTLNVLDPKPLLKDIMAFCADPAFVQVP